MKLNQCLLQQILRKEFCNTYCMQLYVAVRCTYDIFPIVDGMRWIFEVRMEDGGSIVVFVVL